MAGVRRRPAIRFPRFHNDSRAENPDDDHLRGLHVPSQTARGEEAHVQGRTIGQILKDQKLGIGYKVFGEQSIGQYRVTADTFERTFGTVERSRWGAVVIRIEDDEPVLYSGVLFERGKSPKQVFATGLNLIDDTQLKVQNAADVKIKVKAVSLMPNNKKIRVEVGDTDGETRTLHTYNKQEAELKAWAKQELERLKRDGLVGSFTTFGAELVDKLDNVGIKIDGERKGVYQVQKKRNKNTPRAVSDRKSPSGREWQNDDTGSNPENGGGRHRTVLQGLHGRCGGRGRPHGGLHPARRGCAARGA